MFHFWVVRKIEYNIGPMSSKGRTIGQGNLVEERAMLKKAGRTMAVSQRIVFHLRKDFLSPLFITF